MTAENQDLAGKVAFVTGAASGIGRTTALAFARRGARVAVADIDQQGNQETARLIEDLGGRAVAVRCDVTSSEDVQTALDKTVEAFGHLDYAFNNAGAEQQPKPTAEMTEEEWDRIITINLRSVFLCLKYEIPLLLRHGGGTIVNTSSGAGIKVFGRGAAYAAAKHGVVGLTKDAALGYAVEHPDQRDLSRHHRHRDDGPVHRRHRRRAGQDYRPGTHRTDGQTGRDRRSRRLAVLR
jgi:NAD(P)-dependent dehydrogenase (short-subunit alcohol dehydrogenase family)